jgi:hypothetical protein
MGWAIEGAIGSHHKVIMHWSVDTGQFHKNTLFHNLLHFHTPTLQALILQIVDARFRCFYLWMFSQARVQMHHDFFPNLHCGFTLRLLSGI